MTDFLMLAGIVFAINTVMVTIVVYVARKLGWGKDEATARRMADQIFGR
jgi:hypothetical protein